MTSNKKILLVAAENDALPGAKVGGVGDVIRDLPKALTKLDMSVDIVLPSYGFLARVKNVKEVTRFSVTFAGKYYEMVLLKAPSQGSKTNSFIIHHEAFAPKGESVYCNDPDHRPFATDATKFALFSMAVAEAMRIGVIDCPDVLHCHDWHTAFILILIRYAVQFSSLQNIRTVFTIHNLAMQGVRPFSGDDSAFDTWYPELIFDKSEIADPLNPHCVNPMRAGIRLAHRVHTVSPTYAEEIQQIGNIPQGIYGGEGLENDLQLRAERGELLGILNACEYPRGAKYAAPARKKIADIAKQSLVSWAAKNRELLSAHWIAEKRIENWLAKKAIGFTVVSIGRVTDQKVRLLKTTLASGQTVLQAILDELGNYGTFILLGSGDPRLEQFLVRASAENKNFIFLNGFSSELSDALYNFGNLFLMPSSFEPCGISQMLAMRAGQPCLVNEVGGLKDTVTHAKNGFSFCGGDIQQQAEAFVKVFGEVKSVHKDNKVIWDGVCKAASKTRFTWGESAKQYLDLLYS